MYNFCLALHVLLLKKLTLIGKSFYLNLNEEIKFHNCPNEVKFYFTYYYYCADYSRKTKFMEDGIIWEAF
jgi:hypothetical protein